MPTFLEMLRNPAFQQAGLGALGRTAGNPNYNPIMEAALAGRQAFEEDKLLREEKEKEAAAELAAAELKKRDEERDRKDRLLKLSALGLKNKAVRSRIKAAFGGEFPEWEEADRREEEEGSLRRREETQQRMDKKAAILEGAEGLPPEVLRTVEGFISAGSEKDAVDLIESYRRFRAPTKSPSPEKTRYRSGPRQSILQLEPGSDAWEVAPGGEGASPRRSGLEERIIMAALGANDREYPARRKPEEEVIRGAIERAALIDRSIGGGGGIGAGGGTGGAIPPSSSAGAPTPLASEVLGLSTSQSTSHYGLPPSVRIKVVSDLESGKAYELIKQQLKEGYPKADIDGFLSSLGLSPEG